MDEEDLEGQDETTVRPSTLRDLPANSMGSFLVAAEVRFGDGSKGLGYLFCDEHDVTSASPSVFIGEKSIGENSVGFFLPGPFPSERIEKRKLQNYKELGRDPTQIFPVSFYSLIPVGSRPIRFDLDGFIVKGDPKGHQTVR